jgi:hypothetical protein
MQLAGLDCHFKLMGSLTTAVSLIGITRMSHHLPLTLRQPFGRFIKLALFFWCQLETLLARDLTGSCGLIVT